jgi:raffinose/stachyose/melibiose transport system permease protein
MAKRTSSTTAGTSFTYLAAILVVGVTVVPLLFTILGGFRTNAQINTSSVFWRAMGNSAIIAILATALAVSVGAMAAFALSRYTFKGREGMYTLFTVGLLFPISAAALPLYLLLRQLNLLEHSIGVALPQAAFSLPITIVILRPFMHAIPGELEDAAAMDGAGKLGFFWRILLPLSRPALTTVAILAFVTSWNAYQLPLLVLSDPSNFTLPLGVAAFQTQYSQDKFHKIAFPIPLTTW